MQTIKIRKPVKGYKLGDVYTVSNNEAHRLIDNGYAELYEPEEEKSDKSYQDTDSKDYENRMMESDSGDKKKLDEDLES